MRFIRVLLVIIAVVCFGIALSYPIRYRLAQDENNSNMEELSAMRSKVRQTADAAPVSTDAAQAVNEAEGVPARETTDAAGETPESEGAATPADDAGPAESTGRDEASEDPVDRGEDAEAQREETGAEAAVDSGMPKRATLPPEAVSQVLEGTQPKGDADPTGGSAAETAEARTGDPVPADGRQADAAEEEATDGGAPAEADPAQPAGQATTAERPGEAPDETAIPEAALTPSPVPTPTPEPTPIGDPSLELVALDGMPKPTPTPSPTPKPKPTASPEPTPTPVWDNYTGPLPYSMLEKVTLDESAILPELQDIYDLNHDLVGWIAIPDTVIDYPVVQTQDSDFYLEHDFYGNENINGQIILDTLCDPWTPSYNLVISGHHMKNGSMFGNLPLYSTKSYWEKHRFVEFDTLMARKQYVVFGAFYSADYDEDEKGFRYNANIQYKMEAEQWLKEVRENQLYDTEIDVQFGDEFITLTTCNRARHRNGRFVVVCRRIREGETFE